MKKIQTTLAALIGMTLLSGCGTVGKFPYRWYYIENENKKYIGANAKDDLPLNICNSTSSTQHDCVMMFKSDFMRLYQEYMEKY